MHHHAGHPRFSPLLSAAVCVLVQVLLASCFAPTPQPSFTVGDVAGTWLADYSRVVRYYSR